MANNKNSLISPAFLQKLETLQLMAKKIIKGSIKGERSSVKRGRSVEFADYRNYVPGDEIRIIDWNIYGRLDKLFIKLFIEEEEMVLYVLIDNSLSMDFGEPKKIHVSRQIAAAISYIALSNFDRVAFGIIGKSLAHYQAPIRGKQQIFRIFDLLKSIKPSGETSLDVAIREFASRKLRPGMVVIISDFLDESDFFQSIRYLAFQKHDIFLIQVMSAFELNPDLGGDLKLVDVETGDYKDVTVTDKLLDMYKDAVLNHCENIKDFSHSIGAGYILAPTSIPFEDLVMEYFRRGALLM